MVPYEEKILEISYQMMSLDIKMEGEAGAGGVKGGGGGRERSPSKPGSEWDLGEKQTSKTPRCVSGEETPREPKPAQTQPSVSLSH